MNKQIVQTVLSVAGVLSGFAFVTLMTGCSRPNPGGGVPVAGVVTFDSRPLEQGSISFHDPAGTTVALGLIKNGSYRMDQSASYLGVPPGQYTVSVLSWIERPGAMQPDGKISKGVSFLPEKYLVPATSGLTADVAKKGSRLNFELVSSGTPGKQ